LRHTLPNTAARSFNALGKRKPRFSGGRGGRSRFHTTSVANIAALLLLAASLRGQRILNIADPMALSVAEIAAAIGSCFDWSGQLVALPDEDSYPPSLGWTPWSVQRPFKLELRRRLAIDR